MKMFLRKSEKPNRSIKDFMSLVGSNKIGQFIITTTEFAGGNNDSNSNIRQSFRILLEYVLAVGFTIIYILMFKRQFPDGS